MQEKPINEREFCQEICASTEITTPEKAELINAVCADLAEQTGVPLNRIQEILLCPL